MQITAAVARAINTPFTVETLSLEEPRFDEVLVRLVATGICHTDISMRDHKIYPVPRPVVLGHEGAGIVERVGGGVTKVQPGDHVILTSNSCGQCPSCVEGTPVYCYDFNAYNLAAAAPTERARSPRAAKRSTIFTPNRHSPIIPSLVNGAWSRSTRTLRSNSWGRSAAAS